MKNSKNEIRAFTSQDICDIIKQCGQSGVRELTLGGLMLSFGKLADVSSPEPVFVPEEIQNQSDSQAREAIERKEDQIKRDLIDSLLVEDPQGYEQLLFAGELVDEQSEE